MKRMVVGVLEDWSVEVGRFTYFGFTSGLLVCGGFASGWRARMRRMFGGVADAAETMNRKMREMSWRIMKDEGEGVF